MVIKKTFAFFLVLWVHFATAQQCAVVSSSDQIIHLKLNLSIWNEDGDSVSLQKAVQSQRKGLFKLYDHYQSHSYAPNQWIHFEVKNQDQLPHDLKISLAFVDEVDYYFLVDSALVKHVPSGDLVPPSKRDVDVGQMCFVSFQLPAGKMTECFVRIQSKTDISKQFRNLSLRSIQIYTEKSFDDHFVTSRIYQALFYGAIIVMLFYNLFIFSTTRSITYLSYVGFLLVLIVFMASNSGYMAELLLNDFPRTDLYLRFVSAPLLLISFLVFSSRYLEVKQYSPRIYKALVGLGSVFVVILLLMLGGFWQVGRTAVIVAAIVSFLTILVISIVVMRRGYTPARYFFIANILLTLGASFFAFERYDIVVQNPLTQYSIQLSVVFQSVFFSIGLADRIKLVQQLFNRAQLENVRLEKSHETERNTLIEDKNVALEASNQILDAFIYKTAHDIKGPIARLMGLSNLGLMEIQDSKATSYFHMLKNNSYYLNYLINRLSTAYDIRTREVVKQSFALDQLVQDILKELSFHEEYNQVNFNIHMENGLTLFSDQVLVRFILINLMDNAMRYRVQKQGEAFEIYLDVQTTEQELIITVKENGVGIRAEYIPFLFEMFSKAAGQYKSPGLGLYMAKLSAEKLHGDITLLTHSNPTVFLVTIPLSEEHV